MLEHRLRNKPPAIAYFNMKRYNLFIQEERNYEKISAIFYGFIHASVRPFSEWGEYDRNALQ